MYISKKIKIQDHPLYNNPQYHNNFKNVEDKLFCLTKRDNNCFYTATTHFVLDQVYKVNDDDFDGLREKMESYKPAFERFYGSGFVFDDFFETLVSEMEKQRREKLQRIDLEHKRFTINFNENTDLTKNEDLGDNEHETYDELLQKNIGNNQQAHYTHVMAFIKLIISTFIKMNQDRFEPFIGNVYDYCKYNVDAMNKDAGYVEINAFSDALNIGINVFQVENGLWQKYGENCKISIVLLHTPGHFEPLFDADD